MPDLCTYDYAIIRVVPKVEREEFVNVGVIVSCPAKGFLEARIELDESRQGRLGNCHSGSAFTGSRPLEALPFKRLPFIRATPRIQFRFWSTCSNRRYARRVEIRDSRFSDLN